MFTPLKWALPWSAPPTVPGVPAQASRPARPCPTSQRTRPLMVSPAPARTPVAVLAADRAIADEHDDAADAAVADQHVRAAAERRDAQARLAGHADDGDQLVLAPRLDQQVGGAADLERRERRERRVDGHAARPEACLELGGARLERGRGHRVIVGHGVTDATPAVDRDTPLTCRDRRARRAACRGRRRSRRST